jgi:hypothetical protein
MELKDIEKFLNNAENLYLITVFTLLIITVYVSVIGISTVFMVTDVNQPEVQETKNVIIIIDQIKTVNNYILYSLIGILVLLIGVTFALVYTNKSIDGKDKLSTVGTNLRKLLSIFVLIGVVITVMLVMNAICDNIKSIADTKSTDVEINAKANDILTIQGLYMSIFGIISSMILIVALYVYFVNKIKLINFNAVVPSGGAGGASPVASPAGAANEISPATPVASPAGAAAI